MTALAFGFLVAVIWAVAAMTASRSSRSIGSLPTLAWVMLVGISIAVPLAAIAGWPEDLDSDALGWLTLAGFTNVLGLGLAYKAFSKGHVGVVAALVSTEGALAAVISVVAGERPGWITLAALMVVAGGVALVAAGPGQVDADGNAASRRPAILFALGAATVFAVTLFASGQASDAVPAAWVALPARLVGVVLLLGALPFGVVKFVPPGRRMFWAAVTGVLEVAGMLAFAFGARDSIAITSVVASQFSALAAVLAFLLYRERLVRRQVVGIAAIAIGVGVVAGVA